MHAGKKDVSCMTCMYDRIPLHDVRLEARLRYGSTQPVVSPAESAYIKQLRANSLLPTSQSMQSAARLQRVHISRLAKQACLLWAAIQHVLAVQPEMQPALFLVCKAGQRWEVAPHPKQLWLLKGDAVKAHLLRTHQLCCIKHPNLCSGEDCDGWLRSQHCKTSQAICKTPAWVTAGRLSLRHWQQQTL